MELQLKVLKVNYRVNEAIRISHVPSYFKSMITMLFFK